MTGSIITIDGGKFNSSQLFGDYFHKAMIYSDLSRTYLVKLDKKLWTAMVIL